MATSFDKSEHEIADGIVAALLAEYLRPIGAYLARLVGDPERAEEAAHRTLLAAQRGVDQLPGITERRAWLFGLATSAALSAHQRPRLGWWLRERTERKPLGGEDRALRHDPAEAALQTLPPPDRAALLLYCHHRMTLSEVAAALGGTEDAAKAALGRARTLFGRAHEPGAAQTGHAEIEEQLAVYDSLSPEQQAELNAHLSACASCANTLAAYRRADRALRGLPDARPDEQLEAEVKAWVERTRRGQSAEASAPVRPSPPAVPEPVIVVPAEPVDQPYAGPAPRWERLLVPAVMALLFVVAIWLGTRGQDRPLPSRIETVPAPAVTTDTLLSGRLPLPPTAVPPSVDASGRVTITFACDDITPYKALAQQFVAYNPDISVQLRSTQEVVGRRQSRSASLGSRSSLDASVALASQTDVFCTGNDPALLLDGLVRNLGPLARADDAFAIDEFYPEVLQRLTVAGSLYMIPARFRPIMMRYDPAVFRTVGLRPPSPGWSWDDLLSDAAALTQRDGGTSRRWGFADNSDSFVLARFFSATTSPLAAGSLARDDPFANPEVRRLFQWFDDLYFGARAAPVPEGLASSSSGAAAAGLLESSAIWTDAAQHPAPAASRAAPFPVARAFDRTTPMGPVSGWAISSESQHTDAAWRWISYVSQNLPASGMEQETPARRSVPQMQAFWQAVPEEDRDAYAYALEHLGEWPDMTQVPGMLPLYTELLSMMRGERTFSELTSGRPAPPATPIQPSQLVTITFSAPRDQLREYEDAAAQFSRTDAGIRVKLVASEDFLANRSGTETLWGQMRVLAGRVDALVDPRAPSLVRSGRAGGILYDITGLIPEALNPKDYYPNTFEGLEWRGRNLAVPGRLGLLLIHYSQFMFVQMAVAYPQPGWTWSDFDRTMHAVTLRGRGNSSWWGFRETSGFPLRLLAIRAGGLVDYSSQPATPLIDQSEARAATAWYAQLLKEGLIAPAERPGDDAAMWIGLTDPSVLDAVVSTGVGVAPVPVGAGSTATTPLELYDAFAISAQTEHPNEAWKWLVYLQTHPPAPIKGQGGIPARRDNVTAADMPQDSGLREVIEYALEHTQAPAPLRPEEYLVTKQLGAALDRIIGGQEPSEAIKQAQAGALQDLALK